MGFKPGEIAYLRLAESMGLGKADLESIHIVGDSISASRRRLVRHSSDRLLRLAGSVPVASPPVRPPHFDTITRPSRTQALARPQ